MLNLEPGYISPFLFISFSSTHEFGACIDDMCMTSCSVESFFAAVITAFLDFELLWSACHAFTQSISRHCMCLAKLQFEVCDLRICPCDVGFF